jgi:hypothetical protein
MESVYEFDPEAEGEMGKPSREPITSNVSQLADAYKG